jgi:hypothetical protein
VKKFQRRIVRAKNCPSEKNSDPKTVRAKNCLGEELFGDKNYPVEELYSEELSGEKLYSAELSGNRQLTSLIFFYVFLHISACSEPILMNDPLLESANKMISKVTSGWKLPFFKN